MLRTSLSIMQPYCVGRTRGYDDREVPEPHAIRDGVHRRLTDGAPVRHLVSDRGDAVGQASASLAVTVSSTSK